MTERLPAVDQVEGCADAAGRARLVLALPDSVLIADGAALLAVLRHDRAAHWYVMARLAGLHAVRSPEGDLPPRTVFELGIARRAVRKVGRGGAQ